MAFPSNVNRNTTDYRQALVKMGLRLAGKVLRKHKGEEINKATLIYRCTKGTSAIAYWLTRVW